MKIWLDDVRVAPDGYVWCKSVNQCKNLILDAEARGETIEILDCDHDLGEYFPDGGDGISLIDWLIERDTLYPIVLHTANPVGRANMQRTIDAYYRRKAMKQSSEV